MGKWNKKKEYEKCLGPYKLSLVSVSHKNGIFLKTIIADYQVNKFLAAACFFLN